MRLRVIGKPLTLHTCTECGSVIADKTVDLHKEWHNKWNRFSSQVVKTTDLLDEAVTKLENGK